jgi:DNA-binding HxlR family transcriptional regulator
MVKPPRRPRSRCPINFGLEIFGDRWSLLILRDLLIVGKRSFKELQDSEEGIASNILSERLDRLEKAGIISRQPVQEDARAIHYFPTEAGRKLLPVLVEMSYWGAIHDPITTAPRAFVDAYETNRDMLLKMMAKGFDPRKKES